jgi:hypothetical protein
MSFYAIHGDGHRHLSTDDLPDANSTHPSMNFNKSLSHCKLLYFDASFFLAASRPRLIRSRMFSRSLSSLSLTISTLEGAIPIGTDWPLLFSRLMRSMWMTYLRR